MADPEKVMNFTSLDAHPTAEQSQSLQHHQHQTQQQSNREQLFFSTPNIYDNAQDFVFNEDLYERVSLLAFKFLALSRCFLKASILSLFFIVRN